MTFALKSRICNIEWESNCELRIAKGLQRIGRGIV